LPQANEDSESNNTQIIQRLLMILPDSECYTRRCAAGRGYVRRANAW